MLLKWRLAFKWRLGYCCYGRWQYIYMFQAWCGDASRRPYGKTFFLSVPSLVHTRNRLGYNSPESHKTQRYIIPSNSRRSTVVHHTSGVKHEIWHPADTVEERYSLAMFELCKKSETAARLEHIIYGHPRQKKKTTLPTGYELSMILRSSLSLLFSALSRPDLALHAGWWMSKEATHESKTRSDR